MDEFNDIPVKTTDGKLIGEVTLQVKDGLRRDSISNVLVDSERDREIIKAMSLITTATVPVKVNGITIGTAKIQQDGQVQMRLKEDLSMDIRKVLVYGLCGGFSIEFNNIPALKEESDGRLGLGKDDIDHRYIPGLKFRPLISD